MARSKALLNIMNMVNNEVEELPVAQQFLNDLKGSIERNECKDGYKPSQRYKPSSMHCIRNMYFQIIGAELEGDRASCELVGICESGTDRHDRLQKAIMQMKDNNIDCEYVEVDKYVEERGLTDKLDIVSKQGNETKLYLKDLNMIFLCDGIIRYKGKYYILEIKTETSNKFWSRQDVNPQHILQGTAYSLALELDEVIFVYENRDNCSKKAYLLQVTDDMRQALKDKILNCDSYVAIKQCPPKPKDLDRKTCAYCGYSGLCKREG